MAFSFEKRQEINKKHVDIIRQWEKMKDTLVNCPFCEKEMKMGFMMNGHILGGHQANKEKFDEAVRKSGNKKLQGLMAFYRENHSAFKVAMTYARKWGLLERQDDEQVEQEQTPQERSAVEREPVTNPMREKSDSESESALCSCPHCGGDLRHYQVLHNFLTSGNDLNPRAFKLALERLAGMGGNFKKMLDKVLR